jgi:hypothetical protein
VQWAIQGQGGARQMSEQLHSSKIADHDALHDDHTKEALVKYDEALKYAPNWKQLKEACEAAAKQES